MKKALSLVLTMCMVLSLFATFVISASAEEAVNLAAGKTYTVSETGGNYSDDGVKLTDGNRADSVWAGSWAGFTPNTASQAERGYAYINIDLGVVADVTKVVLHLGIDDGSGIAIPYNVSVAASEDGSTYTVVKEFVPEADKTYGAQDRSTDVEVTTRYIQVRIESYGWAFIDEVEVWGTEVEETVETKVLNLDRANHYDWTEKDYNSTQYTPTASSAGEILLAASTDATADVGGRFGGNYFTWWYVILAEWDANANAYVVTEIDLPGDSDGKPYEAWALGEGKIVVLCNTGYSSTDVAGNADDAAVIKEIVVGDKLTINGSDFATLAAASGALEGVSLTINAPAEEGGEVVITKGDNVASGKTYELNGLHDTIRSYDDDGNQLTDGVFAVEAKYSDPAYVGLSSNSAYYTENNNVNVVVDLGESKDIYSVLISVSHENGNGIKAPSKITVSVSDDKTTWSDPIELAYTEELVTGLLAKATADVNSSGRYVKYTLEPAAEGGSWMFIDEVEVYEAKKVVVGNEPEVIVETITVDGDLTDTGWAADKWISVNADNGYWQSVPESESISYKYQLRADDTKLYAAFVVDCAAVEGGNGAGTNVRFWINTDSEATVYTHFYDVYLKDGAVAVNAKYNTAKDSNSGANIESSTINAVMTTADGKTYVEFSVDLAEFNGAEGFNYFVCVSNKVNENVCLYYPVVAEDGESRTANLPYAKWYAEGQATVDVEAIQLGEVVVDGGTNDNLGDAGIYAIAALALVALIGTAVVIKKRA